METTDLKDLMKKSNKLKEYAEKLEKLCELLSNIKYICSEKQYTDDYYNCDEGRRIYYEDVETYNVDFGTIKLECYEIDSDGYKSTKKKSIELDDIFKVFFKYDTKKIFEYIKQPIIDLLEEEISETEKRINSLMQNN